MVDAGGEGLDVGRVDRREQPDAQLVPTELPVRLGVDDAVLAQEADTALASTPSRSMVPTTVDRIASSATNGTAYGDFSAHPYKVAADCSERATHASSPPRPSIHWSC